MMNVVAVLLVLTSLVSAGFWSPTPDHQKPNAAGGENVIVKEGHRVVVVEYDPDSDGNTKVLISPQDQTQASQEENEKLSSFTDNVKGKARETLDDAKGKAKELFDETKEKAKEAASVLPNLGQGVSAPSGPNGQGPRELICDAYGKCKHKITNAIGKAKETAAESTHDIKEKVYKVEEKAKEKASEAIGKTKEKISSGVHEAKGAAEEEVKEAVDKSKAIKKDASSKIEEVREKGGRELGEISRRGKDITKRFCEYIELPRLVGSTMGVMHLLGFATAYGMCVWVTFVSSYVLAGALPRQQFGVVQSKVFPVYFRLLGYSVMVALIGHLYGQRHHLLSPTVGMAQSYSLLLSFVLNSFNFLYLEPKATKLMYKRMKLEKEESRGHESDQTPKAGDKHASTPSAPPTTAATVGTTTTPTGVQEKLEARDNEKISEISKLGDRLKKLNAYSSSLNILTLMALTWHLVYLGQRIP